MIFRIGMANTKTITINNGIKHYYDESDIKKLKR
jgi:hypothetical protein